MRSIQRLVEDWKFQQAFDNSSREGKKYVKELIDKFDKKGLAEWIRVETNEPNMIQLREIAKSLGVKNYGRLCKTSLLSEIERCKSKP